MGEKEGSRREEESRRSDFSFALLRCMLVFFSSTGLGWPPRAMGEKKSTDSASSGNDKKGEKWNKQ